MSLLLGCWPGCGNARKVEKPSVEDGVAGAAAEEGKLPEAVVDLGDVTLDAEHKAQGQSSPAVACFVWITLLVCSFCISGVVFGWPALVLIFNAEGVYTDLCPIGVMDCPERLSRLNGVFSAGFFCCFAGRLVWGPFLDRFGPRKTAVFGVIINALGAIVMAISFSGAWVQFELAYGLIGIAGPGVHLATFHVSNLFPEKKRTITASVSAVFGTSGLVPVIWKAAHSAGASAEIIFVAYVFVLAIILLVYLAVQPDTVFKPTQGVQVSGLRVIVVDAAVAKSAGGGGAAGGGQADQKSKTQALLDWRMLGLGLFFSVSFLHLAFYLGHAEILLNRLGDRELGNPYLVAFNIIGSCALLLFYPVGRLMDKLSWDQIFTISLTLALGFNVLTYIENLQIQVLGFCLWTLSRLIMFSAFFSMIPETVGFKRFGFVAGMLSALSAIIGLLNVPLGDITVRTRSTKPVMLGLLAVQLLSALYPFALWRARVAAEPATE